MSQMFLDYTARCGYGVKMPRLGTEDGRMALFPLPFLAEQKRIVKKLETLLHPRHSNVIRPRGGGDKCAAYPPYQKMTYDGTCSRVWVAASEELGVSAV